MWPFNRKKEQMRRPPLAPSNQQHPDSGDSMTTHYGSDYYSGSGDSSAQSGSSSSSDCGDSGSSDGGGSCSSGD